MISLTLTGVSKTFGSTLALSDVSATFKPGEIHALVGENGAGKSTLGKVLTGVHLPDTGEMRWNGTPVGVTSPSAALALGIAGIAQELSLIPTLSVAENIMLADQRGWLRNARRTREAATGIMDRFDLRLDPDSLVASLSIADQQQVEILRALGSDAELIVFDEPTARLHSHDAQRLRGILRGLADAGKAIVYVSHFLEEVLAISDRITVLRNGRLVRSGLAQAETRETLIAAMTGSEDTREYPELSPLAAEARSVLEVQDLCIPGADPITFTIKAGEVLGLTGLVGAGRSEIARGVLGADPTPGRVLLDGADVSRLSIGQRIAAGMAYIPEDRRHQGLMMDRAIEENATLPHSARFSGPFGLNLRRAAFEAGQACQTASVVMGSLSDPVTSLSGGNQQKVLFARAHLGRPKLLIVDEPTRGVDVGSKRRIYDLIAGMVAQGVAVLMVSSELEEIMGLCHRTLVISDGRISGAFPRDAMTAEALMTAAFQEV